MTVRKTRYTWYTHKRSRRVQVAEIRTARDPTERLGSLRLP